MKSFANALLDSNRAALADGPTICSPRASKVSTIPVSRGASGPAMVMSTQEQLGKAASASASFAEIETDPAVSEIPAFPGAQNISTGRLAVFLNAQQSACSRPPDPTTRIFMTDNSKGQKKSPQERLNLLT